MAGIVMQDPLTTEVQSPFLAGLAEGLNKISTGIDMKVESLSKVAMNPVQGLESSDPRRIYQVADGNRLWLNSPEPQFYLNDSSMSASVYEFSIDYIGGSITFYGSYRPSASDKITVSCDHIYSAPQISGGYEIMISFASEFIGQEYTVTGGGTEYYSGVVPASMEEMVRVNSPNTEYTITAKTSSEETYSTKVMTGQYYGKYEVNLTTFIATVIVNAVANAEVTVTLGGLVYTQVAGEGGTASISVKNAGEYTVKAYYQNVYSDTKTVNVESSGSTYNVSVSFITLTVTVDAGASISVTDGATTLQGTSETGSALFYLPNTGTWTVSASKDDLDTEDVIIVSAYTSYSITLNFIQAVLEDNAWAMIKNASDKNLGESFWEVGDTKSIIINGEVQGYTFSNLSIDTFIIGFNHNADVEGNNRIHFMIGKISSKDVALCDNNYNNTGSSAGFRMNQSVTNSGGWNASYGRNTLLGNSGTPTSPVSSSFVSALPEDLRAVIKSVTKWTDNVGGSNSSSSVTSTTDYLFIPAEFEVQGSITYANQYEKNHQTQYSYFSSGNSKVSYKHTSPSAACVWWCRSPHYHYSGRFVSVSTDGSSDYDRAYASFGVRPCFCV